MISLLKRTNRGILYALVGVVTAFSILKDLLMMAAATAYSVGTSYTLLVVLVCAFSALVGALIVKVFVYLSYRICTAIFRRRSGLLYPFPIGYREFESTWLAFAFPCFLLAGLLALPAVFLPTFSSVSGAVRSVITWAFLALGDAYMIRNYGHDYDRKSLAFSLSIIPIVWLALNLIMTITEVIR